MDLLNSDDTKHIERTSVQNTGTSRVAHVKEVDRRALYWPVGSRSCVRSLDGR